jgi:DNA-binding CsgD family transcriptional regulator
VTRRLTKDELRRCDLVLDAVAGASSLQELPAVTLAALDEQFGYGQSEFMLALAEGDWPGHRAYGGINHGAPPYAMEEYFERWADADALTSEPSRFAYYRSGRSAVREFYAQLSGSHRDYVDVFLKKLGEQEEVSFRLAAGWSDGYLTLANIEDETVIQYLVPALTALLQQRLPRGLDIQLTVREGQVAELVALGFTNKEIAAVLHVEEDTVKKHVSRAMERVGVSRRTQLAVAWATGTPLTLPA